MKTISITETDTGWQVVVEVEGREFSVDVDRETLGRLMGATDGPEALVEVSFKFLLDNEPLGSIMSSFNLEVISNYFPNYEQEIGKYL